MSEVTESRITKFSIEEAAIFNHPLFGEDDPNPIYNTTDKDWSVVNDNYRDSSVTLGNANALVQRMFLCFIALAEGRELPDALEGDEQ